ncbi:MAG: type 4 pilus major pilin, partial [Rhodoferax sp.]
VFPSAMVSSDRKTVTNQWGGAVTVGTNSATELQIAYAAVPTYECRNLLPQVEQLFSSITVGTKSVKTGGVGTAFSLSETAGACQSGTTVSITFGIPK